jgi:hypothetical protein
MSINQARIKKNRISLEQKVWKSRGNKIGKDEGESTLKLRNDM